MSAPGKAVGRTSAWLAAAGIAMSIGGQMHPRGEGETVDDFISSMFASSTWDFAHLAMLAGAVLGVVGFVVARRGDVFGASVRPWLTVAIAGWSFAALELVPHVFAASELEALRSGDSTPLLDLHLALQMLATPAFGLSSAALGVAVARDAGTRPAWALAALVTVTGTIYAMAGPVINLTDNTAFAPMFAAQAGVAIWLVGTAVRLRQAKAVQLQAAPV